MSGLVIGLTLLACSADYDGQNKDPENQGDDTGTTSGVDDGATDSGAGDDTAEDDADGDGYTESGGDCDDADATVFPGAPELCDEKDNDCDGHSDADDDVDGDGVRDCIDDCPIWVDDDASSGGDGSWASPMLTVQGGIDRVPPTGCTLVRVLPGYYPENVDFGGIDADVESTDGSAFTTIDGGKAGSVVTFSTGESASARLAGFTVTDGLADRGGGLHIDGASPRIEYNAISDNVASGTAAIGGGIYLADSQSLVLDNVISGNDAGYGGPEEGSDGGGLFLLRGAPTVEGNQIVENTAGDGGGIWTAYADATIVQNQIAGNAADDQDAERGGQGGGINVQVGTDDTLIAGNTIWNNVASTHGGGVAVYEYNDAYGDPTISNNTIAGNNVTDTDQGDGLCVYRLTAPVVVNNSITHNDDVGVYTELQDASFSYNNVFGHSTDWAGEVDPSGSAGQTSNHPSYYDFSDDGVWTNEDFSLEASSPLIDAGSPSISDTDGSTSDIGATGGPYGI